MFAFFSPKEHNIIIKSRTVRLTSMYDLHHDRKIICCCKCSCLATFCTSTHSKLQNFSKLQDKKWWEAISIHIFLLLVVIFFLQVFVMICSYCFFLSWSLSYIENKVVNSIWFFFLDMATCRITCIFHECTNLPYDTLIEFFSMNRQTRRWKKNPNQKMKPFSFNMYLQH